MNKSKKDIIKWNAERGLLEDFNVRNQAKIILEECLELLTNDKQKISDIISYALRLTLKDRVDMVDVLDAFGDISFSSTGAESMAYKSLNKNATIDELVLLSEANLKRIIEANNQKSATKNSEGKIVKPLDFKPPITPLYLSDLTDDEKNTCCCKDKYNDCDGQIL